MRRSVDADRRIADRLENGHIDRRRSNDHGDGAQQPRLLVLPQERDAEPAGMELKHHVRLGGTDLRHLRRIVGLVEAGIGLADDLALEQALEAGERVLPGLIIRRQDERLLVSEIGDVLAGALVQ